MATLRDVLIRGYGYGRGDFGTAGLVRLDCEAGTISPVPLRDIFTPYSTHPGKVVRLASLFQPQQIVVLSGIGREPSRRFRVLMVSGDGVMAQTETTPRRFLPWASLRSGLIRPDLMAFEGDSIPAIPPAAKENQGARKGAKSLCTPPGLAL
jgi:hypothetical protein